jgi:hypothetical protein
MLNYLKQAQRDNIRLSETIRTSIIALNMVQLPTERTENIRN